MSWNTQTLQTHTRRYACATGHGRLHKDARGSLAVRSVVLRVLSVEGSAPLFPSPSSHHRCLLAIDPLLRHVTLFYHAFYPMM